MAFGTGIDAQIGIGEESTYGTYAEPSRFFEFNSESITPTVTTLRSAPLGRGRVQHTSRVRTFVTGGGGDINIDGVSRGMGLYFKHMFGKVVTAQVAETDEYTHTFTPDNENGKRGLSATVQVGRPSTDGTVQPFSYLGGKITGWEISAAVDDIMKVNTTWIFKNETTSEDLATPSYAEAPEPFTFLDGSLSIGGSAVATVKGVSVAWEEALDDERRYFGNTKGEPLANGMLAVTGTLESEFNDLTAYNAWVAGTEVTDLVIAFEGSAIPGESNPFKVVITIPSLKYTGDAPQIGGPEIVQANTPFEALYNGTEELITLVYHTDDTEP